MVCASIYSFQRLYNFFIVFLKAKRLYNRFIVLIEAKCLYNFFSKVLSLLNKIQTNAEMAQNRANNQNFF